MSKQTVNRHLVDVILEKIMSFVVWGADEMMNFSLTDKE